MSIKEMKLYLHRWISLKNKFNFGKLIVNNVPGTLTGQSNIQ